MVNEIMISLRSHGSILRLLPFKFFELSRIFLTIKHSDGLNRGMMEY